MLFCLKKNRTGAIFLAVTFFPLVASGAPVWGQTKKETRKTASSPYHAIQMDESYPVEELEDLGFETHKAGSDQKSQETPPARERNAFFAYHGLTAYVRGWNEFDKDMLFLRLMKQPAARVGAKYPAIPGSVIATAQAALVEAGLRKESP